MKTEIENKLNYLIQVEQCRKDGVEAPKYRRLDPRGIARNIEDVYPKYERHARAFGSIKGSKKSPIAHVKHYQFWRDNEEDFLELLKFGQPLEEILKTASMFGITKKGVTSKANKLGFGFVKGIPYLLSSR